MKIGHCSHTIWAPGGVASYIRRIGLEQKRLGHEVVYFDLFSTEENDEGAEAQTYSVKDEDALFQRVTEEKIDILHLHIGLKDHRQFPIPVIRTVHGHQPYCPSGGRFLKRQGKPCDRPYNRIGCVWNHFASHCGSVRPLQMLAGFRATDVEMQSLSTIPAITVSHFLKDEMVRSGYNEDLIHVLHLPIQNVETTAQEPPKEGVPHFVFLGRITPQKGVAWLLRAIKEVKRPIHLDIAGEGYQEPEMRRLCTQLGIENQVTFHGWLSAEKVNALLSQSRALVFPSVWHEPAGFVSLDAMTNGRAVIASRVGGIPEYVSDEMNGLLVEPNSVSALAQAIDRVAKNWSLAQALGENGRRMAPESFSLQIHIERLMSIYAMYTPSATAVKQENFFHAKA